MPEAHGSTSADSLLGASEVAKKEHSRVFEVSDELAAHVLLDWSEPCRLRLEQKADGTYDLVVKMEPDPDR